MSVPPLPPKEQRRLRNKDDDGIPRTLPRIAGRGELKRGPDAVRRRGGKNSTVRSFRPESKAEAILLLDDADKPAIPAKTGAQDPRVNVAPPSEDDTSLPATTPSKGAHPNLIKSSGSAPNLGGRFSESNDRKPQRARGLPTPARSTAPVSLPHNRNDGLSSGSTDRTFTRLPQSVKRKLGPGSLPRRSKILPALPQEDAVPPASQIANTRLPRHELFQLHKDKVIRGSGSPQLKSADIFEETAGTLSSPESRERTWPAFEKLGAAKNSDEIRHARLELWRREEKEGISIARGWSKPTFRRAPHEVDPSNQQCRDDSLFDRGRRKSRNVSRPSAPTITRRVSSASVYSIVIQPSVPTRELSPLSDAPSTSTASSGLYVAQEDMPQRIRRILQTRSEFSFHGSGPNYSASSPHDNSYHADLSLTIQTLRNISNGDLDNIDFDMDDG